MAKQSQFNPATNPAQKNKNANPLKIKAIGLIGCDGATGDKRTSGSLCLRSRSSDSCCARRRCSSRSPSVCAVETSGQTQRRAIPATAAQRRKMPALENGEGDGRKKCVRSIVLADLVQEGSALFRAKPHVHCQLKMQKNPRPFWRRAAYLVVSNNRSIRLATPLP